MAQIAVLERKCTGCGLCSESRPFGAIDMKDGKPELNAACRVCGICVKNLSGKAMIRLETRVASVDKSQWKDILVFCRGGGWPAASGQPGADREGEGTGAGGAGLSGQGSAAGKWRDGACAGTTALWGQRSSCV